MPLDTSIPLQVRPPKFDDPIESATKAYALRDLMSQSEARQMQMQQARSQMERQTKLRDLYTQMPGDMPEADRIKTLRNAGYLDEAERIETAGLKRDETRSKIKSTEFETAKKQLDLVSGSLASLLSRPQVTTQDAIGELSRLVQLGVISPEQGAASARQLPGDPGQLRQVLLTHAMQAVEAGKRLEALTPKLQTVNLGGSEQVVDMNPYTRGAAPTTFKKTATPGELLQAETTRRGQNMADARAREATDVQKQAARVQVMDTPDGIMLVDKGTGLARPAAKMDGKPIAGKEKALTESQAKAASFLGQMKAAEETIGQIGPNQVNLIEQANVAAAGSPLNILASSKGQQTRQAQEQWAEAFLRYKTGAAATEAEVKRNVRTFFPQMGDSQAVIDQKARMREQAVADIAVSAGPGAKQIEVVPSIKERSASKAAPKPGTVEGGYIFMGGDAGDPKNWRKQ